MYSPNLPNSFIPLVSGSPAGAARMTTLVADTVTDYLSRQPDAQELLAGRRPPPRVARAGVGAHRARRSARLRVPAGRRAVTPRVRPRRGAPR